MISCGDLPAYYLDYLVSKLDVPLYAVHGNHDAPPPLQGSEGFGHCGAHWIGGRGVRTPAACCWRASTAPCATTAARTSRPRPRCRPPSTAWCRG